MTQQSLAIPAMADPQSPPPDLDEGDASPSWMKWVTRIALILGLAGLTLMVWQVGPHPIWGQLAKIGWWFAVLMGLEAIVTVCDSGSIYFLTRGPEAPSYARVLVAQMAGHAVNLITPGGNLGEALKASLLSEHTSMNRVVAALMYTTMVGFVISLAAVALGAPLSALWLDFPLGAKVGLIVAGLLAAALAGGITVLIRRGMLVSLVGVAERLHLVSARRRHRWARRLSDIDTRLRGGQSAQQRHQRSMALAILTLSKSIGWFQTWLTVYVAGYTLGPGELTALMSSGVVLSWLGSFIPMGLGVAEGGNYALFRAIGAPATLGVSLSLARRVNQIGFALLGFIALGLWKLQVKVGPRRQQRARPPSSSGR